MVLVDDCDGPCFAPSKLKSNRRTHDAGTDDHEVGGSWKATGTHATAPLNLPFFQSRNTWCAALCPGAPVTPPPGCAPAPHKYSPAIGVRYCDQPATGRLKNSCSSVR